MSQTQLWTAIFVAGGAGLKIFWAWVAPQGTTRSRALAREGLSLITVAIGLVGVLGVSGLVEGFVTPSGLPWSVHPRSFLPILSIGESC